MTIIRVDKVQDYSGGVKNAWEFLQTQVASGDTEIDVIDVIGSHVMYKFFWNFLQAATESGGPVEMFMRTSTNNGGDWDAGSTDYAWAKHRVRGHSTTAHTVDGDNADTKIKVLSPLVGAVGDETSATEITLFNPSGTEYTKFKWENSYADRDTGRMNIDSGAGMRLSAADVTGVRFYFNTGNINTGTLKVYGLLAS